MEDQMRKLGRDFSQKTLMPRWEASDAAATGVLGEILKEAAAAGLFGFSVPEEVGGAGLGAAEYRVFIEEISRACAGIGALLTAHFAGISPIVTAEGADALALLSHITAAEREGAPALFVPAVWEEAVEFVPEQVETTAAASNGTYAINGGKTKVIGAAAADCFTVLARDLKDGAYLWVVVPRGAKGVVVLPEAPRMGLRICPVNNVTFNDVEIPSANMIVRFTERGRLLDYHRAVDSVLAAVAIGMAAEARETAMKYALERYQGGKMICDHDVVRMLLSDMDMACSAARAFAYGTDAGFLASAFAAEAAEKTCLNAVQILGGYGYMKDYRIEKILRDAKTFSALLRMRARRAEAVRGEIEKLR
ncbi:MAG: acyl-CoA dehydrogenase family protein [bacterium]